MEKPMVVISGGFDPIHPGHLFLIDRAARMGELVIIANGDDFLARKKGRPLMCLEDRISVLEHIVGVSRVVVAIDKDDTVCRTLEMLQPNIFLNSGDRKDPDALPSPEVATCRRIGCQMVFVKSPYTNHSSRLLASYHNKGEKD